MRRALTYLAGVAALAGAYYLGAQVGLLASDENHIAYVWPPAGIAVAALFRCGVRYWPGVLLGALACELQLFPWWVAVGVAAGTTVGPVVAVRILENQ